jgi:predicted nucleic acid-binding Zn ribbon protein
MPTYVYKFIDSGETIEVQQSFDEPTLTAYPHPVSGQVEAVKKVFLPVGVTFRGNGFYKTDSRSGSSKRSSSAGSSGSESSGSSEKSNSDSASGGGSSDGGSSGGGSSDSSSSSSSSTSTAGTTTPSA